MKVLGNTRWKLLFHARLAWEFLKHKMSRYSWVTRDKHDDFEGQLCYMEIRQDVSSQAAKDKQELQINKNNENEVFWILCSIGQFWTRFDLVSLHVFVDPWSTCVD